MEHYVIITKNMTLMKCIAAPDSLTYDAVTGRLAKNLKTDVVIGTSDKEFAYLALFEGSKVYESYTHASLIPDYEDKETLINNLVELFLEALCIPKHDRGYDYLKYMIKCHVEDENYYLQPMGGVVYPECANVFGVSPKTVSRYANFALKNSFKRNALKHLAVWGDMAVGNVCETLKVAYFTVYAGEKIRALLPKA